MYIITWGFSKKSKKYSKDTWALRIKQANNEI